jgi:cell division protein FtsA
LSGHLTSGVVLTGGGSVLHGMADLAERVFRTPVRLGVPLLDQVSDVDEEPKTGTVGS